MSKFDAFDEDDDDDYEGEYEEYDEEEENALLLNECTSRDITHELVALNNDQLTEFLIWHLDKCGFEKISETQFVGFEFNGQYIISVYNLREDAIVKSATGAGNVYAFIDQWYKKIVGDLIVDELFGPLGDCTEKDMIDVNMSILLDIVEWKTEHKLPLVASKGDEPESIESDDSDSDDK